MPGGSASPIAISPSPAPSSPCTAGPALAPRAPAPPPVLQKPDTPVPAGGIVTQKEWVIPPRPKPGRKPATDTPPTKRKAQNRAAQRAFRERRAARVNELEDKLKEVMAETQQRDRDYLEQIAQLTRNNAELARENALLKQRLEESRREIENLQQRSTPVSSNAFLTQVASPAPSSSSSGNASESGGCERGGDCMCQDVVERVLCERRPPPPPTLAPAPAVPLRRRNQRSSSASHAAGSGTQTPEPLGCGSCTKDGECACYNEAVAPIFNSSRNANSKRSTSPNQSAPKRTRTSTPSASSYAESLETDFTSFYAHRKLATPSSSSIIDVPDPCGFCSDGTPCVCAEVANAMDMSSSDVDDIDVDEDEEEDVKLAPILRSPCSPPRNLRSLHSLSAVAATIEKPQPLHPPPTASVPSSSASTSNSSAGGCRPGSCQQCRDDPMSRKFCQSVAARCGDIEGLGAAKRSSSSSKKASKKSKRGSVASAPGAGEKTYIPTSAAYKTLSRHRGFAQEDLGALVRPLVVQGVEGRCPQVELSSVRDVLKQLDRRFGSEM